MQIEDGRGNGTSAGVNKSNRIMATSTVLEEIDDATARGESFNITTDILTLTNAATENAILYISNTNPLQTLALYRLNISLGKSNATGDVLIRFYANPTGGTLIYNGIDVPFVQRNLGSRFVAQGTARKMSAMAQNLVGGTLLIARIFLDGNSAELPSGVQIPAGSSMGITITTPTGNTSMRAAISASVYYMTNG